MNTEVCFPIPLNWIVALALAVWMALRIVPESWWERDVRVGEDK